MTDAARELDLVVWGATGFTGRLVAAYVARQARERGGLRWGLGGRDREKLEAVRAELASGEAGAAELPLVLGDSLDEGSMAALAARARVVCSTVGPYQRYGTPLVAACAEAGTDYCDLTGEVPWMRRTVELFHDVARASGARIVHACGFDSVPSDVGTWLLHERLEREGRRLARARLRVRRADGGFSGGTIASLVEIVRAARHDREVRRVLADPYALAPAGERSGPDRGERFAPAHDDDRGRWTGPFLMAGINTRVVRRTNALLGYPYGREFRYDERVDTGRGLAGRARATGLSVALGAFTGALAFPPTGRLLERFVLPSPGEGPSEREREEGSFEIEIHGTSDPGPDGREPLRARATVAADVDPGYAATARMLGEAALCLALDPPPGATGGVLTPAAAFRSRLAQRLRAAGFTFEAELVGAD